MMEYHIPVLAEKSIDALIVSTTGVYADVTFGGGGHSKMILERLDETGKLFGFDTDEDAKNNVPEDDRFTFIGHNFRYIRRFLKLYGAMELDGVFADLGVSSFQFDTQERGFSYRFDTDLDMRMNVNADLTAQKIVNSYSVKELQEIFSRYGEVRNSKTLAYKIEEERGKLEIKTTGDLIKILEPLARGNKNRYYSQVFQALRIEVNDEMGALEEFLTDAYRLLKVGGRIVVISYHSLEDRLVKNFLKTGNVKGEIHKDFYGNISRPFKLITKKPIVPTEEEIKMNARARSAKLRIGEKVF